MDWCSGPLENQRRFAPPFCPRRDCSQHRLRRAAAFRYKRDGSYRGHGGKRIQRYHCFACRRGFSRSSFTRSYYLKRPALLVPIAAGLVAGSAHRQIARSLGCAHSTVTRLSARLGRHALLLLARAHRFLPPIEEPVVLDHFETFEGAQDYPFGVATGVGQRSLFVYVLDPCPHARTGRRSAAQQARLKSRPSRLTRGGYEGSFRRALDILAPLSGENGDLRLVTDGHPAYERALERHPHRRRVRHLRYPNPERGPKGSPRSAEARRRDAAMFPNDLWHLLLRHSLAHHRRKTIAFGRRLNALMERLFLASAWRNFIKGVSERKPDPTTPAMRRGLASKPWTWSRLLGRRLFPDREQLPPTWLELYRREWISPFLPANTLHHKARAF
jgi:transposase-like protein